MAARGCINLVKETLMSEFDNPGQDLSQLANKFVEPQLDQANLCPICLVDQTNCAGQSHSKLAVQARTYTINKLRNFGNMRSWLRYLSNQQKEHPHASSSDTTGDVQRFDNF